MRKPIIIPIVILTVVMACLYSCKTDAPLAGNEYITTVKVIATNQADLSMDTFTYVNFNEAVSNPPSHVDTIKLKAGATYAIKLKLENEASNPLRDLTDTITATADNHLMLYNVDPGAGMIAVKIIDKDSKGLPLGLMSTWQTKDTTNGFLRLILRHQPGSKNGTQLPGNVDFEADYPVMVK